MQHRAQSEVEKQMQAIYVSRQCQGLSDRILLFGLVSRSQPDRLNKSIVSTRFAVTCMQSLGKAQLGFIACLLPAFVHSRHHSASCWKVLSSEPQCILKPPLYPVIFISSLLSWADPYRPRDTAISNCHCDPLNFSSPNVYSSKHMKPIQVPLLDSKGRFKLPKHVGGPQWHLSHSYCIFLL